MLTIITNDDGIDAPGIAALWQAVAGPKIIVAPRRQMSECSHCVTTKCPIAVEQRAENQWAVDGSPADCTRVALLHVLPALGYSLDAANIRVVSGINNGGNLGADVYISGTVAAVREAAFFGIPGVSLSHYRNRELNQLEWARAARWAKGVLDRLIVKPHKEGTFWNVNFPCPPLEADDGPHLIHPPVVECARSRRPLPVKYETVENQLSYVSGRYHSREYEAGSDIDVCFNGRIAVSLIEL